MEYDFSKLPKIEKKGIALDIDETLSWTVGYWIKGLQKLAGNPEGLSVEEIIKKYRYTSNVPYWQTKEAIEWLKKGVNSNEVQTKLEVIEGALPAIKKIKEIVPIVAYITVRPEGIIEGTKTWLKEKGFPKAPIICRPKSVSAKEGNEWKAKVLEELYPNVKGIIDDNKAILKYLNEKYKGKLLFYDNDTIESKLNAHACKTWKEVIEKVESVF